MECLLPEEKTIDRSTCLPVFKDKRTNILSQNNYLAGPAAPAVHLTLNTVFMVHTKRVECVESAWTVCVTVVSWVCRISICTCVMTF